MSRKYTIEVYKDEAGEFRWRLKAGNGQIVAGPQEGYKRRAALRSELTKISLAICHAVADLDLNSKQARGAK